MSTTTKFSRQTIKENSFLSNQKTYLVSAALEVINQMTEKEIINLFEITIKRETVSSGKVATIVASITFTKHEP